MKQLLLFAAFLLSFFMCDSDRTVSKNPNHKYFSLPIEHLYGETYLISLESDVPKNYWDGSPVRIFSNELGENGEIVTKKELGLTDNAYQVKLEKDNSELILCYEKEGMLEVREFTKGFQLKNQNQIELPKQFFSPIILSKQDILLPYYVVEKKTDFRAIVSIHGKKYSKGKLIWDKKLLKAKSDSSTFNTLTDLYGIDNESNFIFEGYTAIGENGVLSYQKNTFLIKFNKDGTPVWKFETDSVINLAAQVRFDQNHLFTIVNNDTLDYPTLLRIDKETGRVNTTILKKIPYEKATYVDNLQIMNLGESIVIFGRRSKRGFMAKVYEDTIFALKLSNTIPPKVEKYTEYSTKDKSRQIHSMKAQQIDENEVVIISNLLSRKQISENSYSNEKTGEWILHVNQHLEVLQETVLETEKENNFIKLGDGGIYILSQFSNDSLNDNFIHKGFDVKTYNSIKVQPWNTNIEINRLLFD